MYVIVTCLFLHNKPDIIPIIMNGSDRSLY